MHTALLASKLIKQMPSVTARLTGQVTSQSNAKEEEAERTKRALRDFEHDREQVKIRAERDKVVRSEKERMAREVKEREEAEAREVQEKEERPAAKTGNDATGIDTSDANPMDEEQQGEGDDTVMTPTYVG